MPGPSRLRPKKQGSKFRIQGSEDHQGKLPPVVEQASRWYTDQAEIVAELRGTGKKIRQGPRSRVRGSASRGEAPTHKQRRLAQAPLQRSTINYQGGHRLTEARGADLLHSLVTYHHSQRPQMRFDQEHEHEHKEVEVEEEAGKHRTSNTERRTAVMRRSSCAPAHDQGQFSTYPHGETYK